MADPLDDQLLEDYFGPLSPTWTSDNSGTTDTRSYVTVPVTKLYGDSLYGKPRGVRIDQGTNRWLRMVLISQNTGGPIVLTVGQYSSSPTVLVRYREATGTNPSIYVPDDGDVAELSTDGRYVALPIPVEVKDHPGVYRLQVMVKNADNSEVARDECVVLVDRGMWLSDGEAPSTDCGPPTLFEVRNALRDHPGVNRLLGDYKVDSCEVGNAIVSAVQAFNAEFPHIPHVLNTRIIPTAYRRPIMDGVLSFLFETLGEYNRQGHLPYSAGGLSIDDLNKGGEYTQIAEFYRQRFDRWAKITKAKISIAAGWGSVSSGGPFFGVVSGGY